MSGFLENIKLNVFRVLRKPYKNKLFKDTHTNIELILLSKLLAFKPWLFIDAGANRGEFIFTAEKVLPSDKIWAIEPLPYFAEKLKALFPGIKVFNEGLSDADRQTTLYVPVNKGVPDDSLSSVNKPGSGGYNEYTIQCTTLDRLIKRNIVGKEKIALKIDVEGHEFKVLAGAEESIKNSILIMLIEIEERHHPKRTLPEMIETIESKGFICYHLHQQKNQLIRYSRNSEIFQKKEDLNTRRYINNFWFFAKQMDYMHVVNKLNS
jgi:FkbM family methyltransferase